MTSYDDRRDAGRALAAAVLATLAEALSGQAGGDVVVLALPRGGVPVAAEVAAVLQAPLDVVVVRKLGFPGQPELAFGAVGPGGVLVLNDEIARRVPADVVDDIVAGETTEVARRERDYRAGRPPLEVTTGHVVLVDDGLATGATMRAAVAVVRAMAPSTVVVAVPVGAAATVADLAAVADAVVCPLQPAGFRSVGEHYRDFSQTTDAEVRSTLTRR
jgi:putative phosphoribosyl transferase